MRIWDNFRTMRGTLATLSAVLALLLGALQVGSIVYDSMPSSVEYTGVHLAIAIAALGGAILAMRRGNLALLLIAWAFVMGVLLPNTIGLFNELSQVDQSNELFAVIAENTHVPIAILGSVLAVLAATPKSRRRSSQASGT